MGKILHVPFCFYPDPIGGTEVYVASLAQELRKKNMEVLIAAPGAQSSVYPYEGLRVYRFCVSQKISNLRQLYDEGDVQAAQEFGRILDTELPDVVHLHAFTRGVSLRLLREAKRRAIPVVFTYHTPTVSCQRGTLLRMGKTVCDGKLDVKTCTRCTLQGLGLNGVFGAALGNFPWRIGRWMGHLGASGGFWTALRMTELMKLRHDSLKTFFSEVDHIVVPCLWGRALLLCNGVSQDKITFSRQGVCEDKDIYDRHGSTKKVHQKPGIRMAFLGRLDPSKGADLLIRVFRSIPDASLELDLFGMMQGISGDRYLEQLKILVREDGRIHFRSEVQSQNVKSLLKNYDILVVPSQISETGPLVVLEAFAAGIPVLGSRLGGIAELVRHGVDGLLVEYNSEEAWRAILKRLSSEPGLVQMLKQGVQCPRQMSAVADEMNLLYRGVLAQRSK